MNGYWFSLLSSASVVVSSGFLGVSGALRRLYWLAPNTLDKVAYGNTLPSRIQLPRFTSF